MSVCTSIQIATRKVTYLVEYCELVKDLDVNIYSETKEWKKE